MTSSPAPQFSYGPTPPTPPPLRPVSPAPPVSPTPPDLGPLKLLPGIWAGRGFNTIWRPSHSSQDRFLALNVTDETITFTAIDGTIPNRGFLQDDIEMVGVSYVQSVRDHQLSVGIHFEPGVWLSVPATTAPVVPASVVRLASIPHGTTIVAQGLATEIVAAPTIPPVDLNPFPIGGSGGSPFPEQDISVPTAFRTPDLTGVTQAMVNNPNSVLTGALAGKTVTRVTQLQVTTNHTPILGGGTANTAFLEGAPGAGPNADAGQATATFWIEEMSDGTVQLQYTQNVLLNFNGLSWPHISVATLIKQP